jgi:single-stranded DNA-binding protein
VFLTRIKSTITGNMVKSAEMRFAPDGRPVTTVRVAVGDGSEKYPTMYVDIPVWESVAERAYHELDRKGIHIEASGFLQVSKYIGKNGGVNVAITLKDVRELRVYDRDGELEKVISGEKAG